MVKKVFDEAIKWMFVLILLCDCNRLINGQSAFIDKTHPCARICKKGETMTCRYNFTVEWFRTLSSACFDCPNNVEDCYKQDCIPGDGFERPIHTINRMMPGPQLEVCLGDEIIVTVKNNMMADTTSIHWHGQHQKGTQYMDGVPYVNQCPIHPRSSFVYRFRASEPGTFFWHSHSGVQRNNGANGGLIVRRPLEEEVHAKLYDEDLSEHVLLITDWSKEEGEATFLTTYFKAEMLFPRTLLINGWGTFNSRKKKVPSARFVVAKGMRYRFRLIAATSMDSPVICSVDKHQMLVINSDGQEIEPILTDALTIFAGERYDIIITANQNPGLYWMRFKGLAESMDGKAYQGAVLQYEGQSSTKNPASVLFNYLTAGRKGKYVNGMNMIEDNTPSSQFIPMKKQDNGILGEVDYKFFVTYNLREFLDPRFQILHPNNDSNVLPTIKLPLFNNISMQLPSFPLMSQRDEIQPNSFCSQETLKGSCDGFCQCLHVLEVKKDAVVEVILIDEGEYFDISHPIHLHGHYFSVVGMEKLGKSTTEETVRNLEKTTGLKRNLVNPPVKDTVTVPDGGYTIIRFRADNPGFWLFHCHIEFHMELGMQLVFKVGTDEEMPSVPENFPKCGDYLTAPPPPPLK